MGSGIRGQMPGLGRFAEISLHGQYQPRGAPHERKWGPDRKRRVRIPASVRWKSLES